MKNILLIASFGLLALASAQATTVFGNLGPDNTGDFDTFSVTNTPSFQLAQSFTTGSSFLYLQSVSIGLGKTAGENDASATVSLWSSSGGLPSTVLVTSAPVTLTLAGPVLTTIALPYELTASTTYWVTVNDVSVGDSSPTWFFAGEGGLPGEQNGSGYAYAGPASNSGSGWAAAPFAQLASISVDANAVPEPSTYALLPLAAAGLGGYVLRRRK